MFLHHLRHYLRPKQEIRLESQTYILFLLLQLSLNKIWEQSVNYKSYYTLSYKCNMFDALPVGVT